MEKWAIEAERIAKDVEATKRGLGSPKQFLEMLAEAVGLEDAGSYDDGYQNGYDEGQNDCEECEECEECPDCA